MREGRPVSRAPLAPRSSRGAAAGAAARTAPADNNHQALPVL